MTTYTISVNDQQVASTTGSGVSAQTEAFRYADQYREDGRVTILKDGKLLAILSQITRRSDRTEASK